MPVKTSTEDSMTLKFRGARLYIYAGRKLKMEILVLCVIGGSPPVAGRNARSAVPLGGSGHDAVKGGATSPRLRDCIGGKSLLVKI